jgi:hypothetical protein
MPFMLKKSSFFSSKISSADEHLILAPEAKKRPKKKFCSISPSWTEKNSAAFPLLYGRRWECLRGAVGIATRKALRENLRRFSPQEIRNVDFWPGSRLVGAVTGLGGLVPEGKAIDTGGETEVAGPPIALKAQ